MYYYTIIMSIAIFAMLTMLVCVYSSGTLSKKNKSRFKALFITVAVAAFCEWFGVCLQGSGGSTRIIHTVVKAVELSIAPAIAVLITCVIENKSRRLIAIFLAIHSMVEVLSGFFGFIYYVDENSNYSHESFYWIYIVAYIISIIYAMYIIIRNMSKYQYNGFGFICTMSLFLLYGIVVQVYDSDMKVIYVSTAIASIMLYVFTLEMVQQNDELTGLINRRGYENHITHIEDKCIIIMFDVDKFKDINDKYGHQVGDRCLKEIGSVIRTTYAKYGRCYRIGGDEFCVIANKNIEHIEDINADFLSRVQQSRDKYEWMPKISFGHVYFDPQAEDITESFNEADQRLYKNKKEHSAYGDQARDSSGGGVLESPKDPE